MLHAFGSSPHLSEVEDEAVSFVEAAPGQLHLLGTDVAFPFDLVQPVHRPGALRPPEARLHTTLLWDKSDAHLKASWFLCLSGTKYKLRALWHRGHCIHCCKMIRGIYPAINVKLDKLSQNNINN